MHGALIDHFWQASLFAVLVLAIARSCRLTAPVAQATAAAGLLKFLLPSAVLFRLLEPVEIALRAWIPDTLSRAITASMIPVGPGLAASRLLSDAVAPWMWAAVSVWAAGATFHLWHVVASVRQMMAIRRAATPVCARDRLAFSHAAQRIGWMGVGIGYSARVSVPSVCGLFRQVILLPSGLSARLTDRELRSVIEHELVHARHRDNVRMLLASTVVAIFWWNPLVHVLRKHLLLAIEQRCDRAVVGRDEPREYVRMLTKIARWSVEEQPLAASAAAGADLQRRIKALLHSGGVDRQSRSGLALLSVALLTLIFTAAANPCIGR